MANELPEVVPDVQSMPTTGWFCQSAGSARRRITKNSSSLKSGNLDIEGIYDVAGVPGHTHNASAVVSIDANYSAYRQHALNVAAGVWGYGALAMPVGLLTDSVEPDNADERYDRAIERCVGYTSLFPENCTGHIQEPTRSIGEIRTLVAPKARLDTLTYTEERRGWRLPKDADDVKETSERDELVSTFPDVRLDVRPLCTIRPATIALGISPSSLYMESSTNRYSITADAGALGIIGYTLESDQALRAAIATRAAAAAAVNAANTAANQAALAAAQLLVAPAQAARASSWDGTLRFVWDDDSRSYKSVAVSIVLKSVTELVTATGLAVANAPVYDYDPQNLDNPAALHGESQAQPVQNGHAARITVSFPATQTTEAFDGNCWLGNITAEEALHYASRVQGLALAPRVNVEVLGLNNVGPFKWIGMPAYRIPIGGTYGHPAADVLSQAHGDGTHTDLQHNYWDKFDAFKQDPVPIAAGTVPTDGFLRYHWRQQEAERLHVAAPTAATLNRRAPEVFNFPARIINQNGGMFFPRSGGILRQLTANTSALAAQRNFGVAATTVYATAGGNLAPQNLITPGIDQSSRVKDAGNAANTNLIAARPLIMQADGTLDAASTFSNMSEEDNTVFTLDSTNSITLPNATYAGAAAALVGIAKDVFCSVPMTPLLYQLGADGLTGDFSGDDLYLGKVVNGVRLYVPNVICNGVSVTGETFNIRYDLSDAMNTMQGYRTTGGPGTLENPGNFALDSQFFLRGWSLWVHPAGHAQDITNSNFDVTAGNLPAEGAQVMRNTFRDQFATGNKFRVPAAKWSSYAGPAGAARIALKDYAFALKDTDYSGIYLETAALVPNDNAAVHFQNRKLMIFIPARVQSYIAYEAGANSAPGDAFQHGRLFTHTTPAYVWNQADNAGGGITLRVATHVEINASNNQDLDMYILGPDWFKTHVGNDPFAAVREDSRRLGPVFQSIKRISQHVCAPVLNPNMRIGASAPLNHDTRHLPPELRDFRLQLQDIDWGRLLTDRVTLNELTLYEFKGGVQKVGAEQNIMYLPQFREFEYTLAGNEFSITCFSELGCPSYFCFFCRSATTDILQQPLIKTLSIINETTHKKSNSIQDATVGQLFHLTQRNVHPAAEYGRAAYNRRQTVLLSAEDVGLMGLRMYEYQKAKRVQYTFSGTTDRPGQFYVVLVYNNRGIHVDGRRLQVVMLHE